MAKLKVLSAEPRTDGSGNVVFDVIALDATGEAIGGMHQSIELDYVTVQNIVKSAHPAKDFLTEVAKVKPKFAKAAVEERINKNDQAAARAAEAVSKFNLPVELEM